MRQLLIPEARAKLLNGELLKQLSKRLACRIELKDKNELVIDGDAYAEYMSYSVLEAFGRGFDINTAFKLLSEDCFFKSINLKELFKNEKQIKRMKARVIGEKGKTKRYIEAVSGAEISLYGNTISGIGTLDQLNVAYSAINILLEGGTHKKAYRVMEKARKELAYKL
ncbi:MAG: KH domain-containing protein [Candidatus Micrarchaeia archaeon]